MEIEKVDTHPRGEWRKRVDVRETAVLTVALTIIIGYSATFVQRHALGAPASEEMRKTIRVIMMFTWVSAPVAALVGAMVIVSLLHKPHFGDNPPPEADHSIRNDPRLNAAWIVGSSILCLFAVVVGLIFIQQDNKSLEEADAVHVNAVGQQWLWNFEYPGWKDSKFNETFRSGELYMPVNEDVVFDVSSKDVKHSFWLVQLGVKVDANPGYVTHTAVHPEKIGTYDLRCAELCGLLHAYMQHKIHVVSRADYELWLKTQGAVKA
mgnify:FL=1